MYARMNGLDEKSDFPRILEELSQMFGTAAPAARTALHEDPEKEYRPDPKRAKAIETFASQIKGSPAEKYLHDRGFSDEIIVRFNFGYNPKCYDGGARRSFETLVIPYPGTDYYTERKLDPGDTKKYVNLTGVKTPDFIVRDEQSSLFYICEGQLDAISMIQAGAKNVIASHYVNRIEEMISSGDLKTDGIVIVADRDEKEDGTSPGKVIADRLTGIFTKYGIRSTVIFPPEGFKDANDLLQKEPKKLKSLLAKGAKALMDGLPAINVGAYIAGDVFGEDIEYFKKYKDRKTGFENIDKYLTLYPGLACLGGASSLGKTTFAVNLADNLLRKGEHVIYFALEQIPIELVSKSLARIVYEKDPFSPINNIDIKNGANSAVLAEAKAEYAKIAKNYHIVKGDFHCTVGQITEYVEKYIRDTGVRPVVIVDYLQILSDPKGFKGDRREAIDYNLKALKDLSKKNELFILLISSFNRSSYKEPVGMESFKESGAIEFTCDYLLGLQLAILEDSKFFVTEGSRGGQKDTNNDKKQKALFTEINKSPKEVELVVLKNRNGKQQFKSFFKYEMPFDTFIPDYKSKYDPENISTADDDDDDERIF